MRNKVRHPIRQKIMTSLLFLITVVVGLITLTMAKFFHEDKRSYINDWVSISVLSMAEESRSLVAGYTQRLQLYSKLMTREARSPEDHAELRQALFDDFPDLIEIAIYRDGEELESVLNQTPLEIAGLTKQDLEAFRVEHPLPAESILAGDLYLRNATLSPAMPSMTLAIGVPADGDASETLVAAVIRSDALLRLGARFKVFDVSITDSTGALLAHADTTRVAAHVVLDMGRISEGVANENRAGLTTEFTQGGTQMIGGIADVGLAGLSVIAVIPKSAAYLASWGLVKRLLLVSPALMILVTLVGLGWAHRITRPLETLSDATRTIAQGRFDIELEVSTEDEIGGLASSFNQMATELHDRDVALTAAQSQLIQSEKMAAFGQIGAGIAHEVKNPLTGIYGCAQLSLMELDQGGDIREYLQIIEKEADRCKGIIENLMKFARQEKTDLDLLEVNPVVEDAIAIINHQLEINLVKVHRDLAPDLPMIKGNANQIQQVLMNLMINAQHAMEGKAGSVTVGTHLDDAGSVEIVVRDSGPGIPDEIQSKLFEPFFTTKPTGEGTGLGLSVSFGIIRDHAGEIRVESEVGQGATFIITIPAAPDMRDQDPLLVASTEGSEQIPGAVHV